MLVLNSARDDSVHNPAAFPLAKALLLCWEEEPKQRCCLCGGYASTSGDIGRPAASVDEGARWPRQRVTDVRIQLYTRQQRRGGCLTRDNV